MVVLINLRDCQFDLGNQVWRLPELVRYKSKCTTTTTTEGWLLASPNLLGLKIGALCCSNWSQFIVKLGKQSRLFVWGIGIHKTLPRNSNQKKISLPKAVIRGKKCRLYVPVPIGTASLLNGRAAIVFCSLRVFCSPPISFGKILVSTVGLIRFV